MKHGIGLIIAIVLASAGLGILVGSLFNFYLNATYTYRTLQGSYGEARHCYKDGASLFCRDDNSNGKIIQVSEFELNT